MKTIHQIICFAAVALSVTSCATTGQDMQQSVTKAAGDAAVDTATKNTDPLTGAAIRNATGYGTDPVETKASEVLKNIGL